MNIEFFGGCNLPELYKHITPEKHWEGIVVTADLLTREILPSASRAAGRQIDGAFVIVNLEGFGYVTSPAFLAVSLKFDQFIPVLAS